MKSYHPSSRKILLLLLDELSRKDKNRLESHIRTCSQCKDNIKKQRQFIKTLKTVPQPEPEQYILERCRSNLLSRLRKVSYKTVHPPVRDSIWVRLRSPITILQVGAVTAVFVLGLFLGRYLPRIDSSAREAIFTLKSSLPVDNFHVLSSSENSDNVEIRFKTVQDRTLFGSLKDSNIRYALSYVLINEPRDNIRLKTVSLLGEFAEDETVIHALLHALEKDTNPGVRIKAIKVLKSLPMDDNIKKTFKYALFQDPNSGIRIEAANALKTSADPKMLPILQERAKNDEYLRALLMREGV